MSYTKDYYSILALSPPTHGATSQIPTADLRRAYKLALLSAHPDKVTSSSGNQSQQQAHTVDDVKEAYSVLSCASEKARYDNYVLANPGILQGGGRQGEETRINGDFLLGLEVLDLSDFDVLDPGFKFSSEQGDDDDDDDDAVERNGQMEWTRRCRCGMDKGYVILEEELEDAEGRGGGGGACGVWGV